MDWITVLDSSRTSAPEGYILLQLVVAAVLGGLIGFERELRERTAGLRTHMLTAMAAALFTIITTELAARYASMPNANTDPIRVVEAVTSGVAFIAAGAIIHARGEVKGLTTGAGMWMAGAIGVASGAGYFAIATMSAVLATVILAGLKWFERSVLNNERGSKK